MKRAWLPIALISSTLCAQAQTIDFSSYPVYGGSDLGLTYTKTQSRFRIWSPPAQQAELLIFADAKALNPAKVVRMKKAEQGTWTAVVAGDQKGKCYAFRTQVGGKWGEAVPDPYAKAVAVNGRRAAVVDLKDSNPLNWARDESPALGVATDAVIYELHVRDASIAANSGIRHKGKFLGLTESGTTNTEGLATGLDHLKELGVTHIHLLPCFDFYSVNEARPDSPQYNWGYDPLNYNVPEGSYSTDARQPLARIREFKQLVKAFHENGLRVVMDVVYNHTMLTENSYFNQLVPGYYYRQTAEGKFSNATACNNETASERPMMRKFMLESLQYWVREYHIDGFRFDLMGVHDIATMNQVSDALHQLKPDILLYGEGWTAGASPLPDSLRAVKANASQLHGIAVFSDDIRDGIKGSVFSNEDRGFVSGKPGMRESIKFGIAAACRHPQVDYSLVNYSKAPYAAGPAQTITYAECHDNHVLWDKLAISAPRATEEQRRAMHKLALAIVLTSQGIPFLHAGTEFLRTKKGNENSFNAGDSVNAIDWSLKTQNREVFNYVRSLIQLRKQHPAFRMKTAEAIASGLRFVEGLPEGLLAYTINGKAVGDPWETILVVFNANVNRSTFLLPGARMPWQSFSIGHNQPAAPADRPSAPAAGEKIMLQPISCSIFYQQKQ